MRIRSSFGRLVIVALLVAGCATRVAPIGSGVESFVPDADERALWMQAGREAGAMLKRVRLDDDPALLSYLGRLVERLAPASTRIAGAPVLSVTVVRDPTLSAFALPDGRLFVHTGLLAAVETEAQLALLLSREVAHVVYRDALVATRDGAGTPVRYEGATPLSPMAAAIFGETAALARLAAIDGYGARAEREADAAALASLARGGWDAQGATRIWTILGQDAGERGGLETFLLGAPAWRRARGESMRALTRTTSLPAGGFRTSDDFETHRLRVRRENALEEMRAGRFGLARRQLDQVLTAAPADATAHVYDGDLHRLQAQRTASTEQREAALESALRAYGRAQALAPERADVYRRLGLLHHQRGDAAGARAAFETYLRLAPDAGEARRVAEYVKALQP
jgi:beta-barrel assembly-enhancing protease